MVDEDRTLVSVRGQASRTVEPDEASVEAAITATEQTAQAATTAVAETLSRLRAVLDDVGAEPLTAERSDAPLRWSARSVRTYPEHATTKGSGYGPTGRHSASVNLRVVVRDFSMLSVLTDALADDRISTHGVRWTVDADNPAWPQVRADAIRAALIQGQDYAAALGGSVRSVEHVADAGLLADGGPRRRDADFVLFSGSAASADGSSGVFLDPEPQTLRAVVEARFTATVGPLPTR